ncbi:hypothetical protein B0G75_10344 [Paraburkholderia sp. BL18I3N2]|nr:hypothetical protein B0G75_10344 [Paraburkholderia sp. BL18I3N2]
MQTYNSAPDAGSNVHESSPRRAPADRHRSAQLGARAHSRQLGYIGLLIYRVPELIRKFIYPRTCRLANAASM